MKKTTVFKTAILAFALIICSFSLSAQATLPFSYDGTATSLPTGLTGSGLSSYAATPFIKFAATGNFLILNFAATSGALTFNLKWNPSSVVARFPGTFTLQESVDGVSYTNVQVFDATNGPVLANTVITPITINTLQTTTRYLKWIYTAKSNGNIALGAIVLNAGSTPNVLTLSTQAATSVISTSATLNGTISAFDASSAFVNSYGFCWNTTGTPTIADTKVDKGFSSTIGAYSHSISINPSTTYYARAYATNASGVTSYGSQVSFTTTSGFAAVSTQAATTIASTTATLNGTISSLGDTPVTAHGFCWNTTGTPTTDNSKTDLGVRNATGLMTSNISSLLPSTTYYVRSFATNNVGTFYGNEISFTTKPLGVNEINVTTPGTLSILASSFLSTVTNLTLTGSIDARDFKTMRDNMPLLVNLDMSGVNIVSYLGLEGTSEKSTNYKADAIPAWAFYFTATNTGKVSLKSILLPMTLTTIEASAFDGCTGITSIIFPTNVTTIEEGAFFGCVGLKILELPAMLTSISNDVFIKCTGLTSVNIPSTVNSIGNSAFSNCSSLSSVTIPTSVTSIGSGAFEGCIGLTSFNIIDISLKVFF